MSKEYFYTVRSLSDPNGDKGGLGFNTILETIEHQIRMNKHIKTYPKNWNTDFWVNTPLQWEIFHDNKQVDFHGLDDKFLNALMEGTVKVKVEWKR
jgi:hypothetical protein